MHPVVLAVSGASGALYGRDIFDRLHTAGIPVHLVLTDTAIKIIADELGLALDYFDRPGVVRHDNTDFETPIASGSFLTAGMVIAPCSMGCLGRIAQGASYDLVGRAADVHLKERRPLILLARETPLSAIHLENMLKLNRAGTVIMPASPAFTAHPRTLDDLATFMTGRVFDHLHIPQDFALRYQGNVAPPDRA